jgi:hypothetical protein
VLFLTILFAVGVYSVVCSPLQLLGANPLGSLVLALVIPFVVVVLGTYVGALMALQSFFGESSWQDVSAAEE